MKYCLIGEKLGYSYSARIHSLMGTEYDLVETKKENLAEFLKKNDYDGFNVTIPYKCEIMKHLSKADEISRNIGAANVVKRGKEGYEGYNTDFFGMKYSLKKSKISLTGKRVMVLGNGGAGKTAVYLAQTSGAKEVISVTRKGEINFSNCYDLDAQIIINATPVGTFPDENSPIDLSCFLNLESVMDCVYNPRKTKFVETAERLKLKVAYGLEMLVAQAVGSEEIWKSKKFDDRYIDRLIKEFL